MLKTKTETVVNCFDFDNLVQKTYGRIYCYQQQDGCKGRGREHFTVPMSYVCDNEMHDEIPEVINGSQMGVKFEKWLERDPKAPVGERDDNSAIELFWERNFYPDFGTIVNDLHKKGLIEAGDYTMDIDW